MKSAIMFSLVVMMSSSVFAKTVKSGQHQVEPSNIDQVIRLVDKTAKGSAQKKVSIIVEDKGLSTDVSPRYTVYMGFASLAEMGNVTANFVINENAYKFISATRVSAGVYEVKTVEYRDEDGMVEVTQTIDASKVYLDEQKLRKDCASDFCDKALETTIELTETTKKQ